MTVPVQMLIILAGDVFSALIAFLLSFILKADLLGTIDEQKAASSVKMIVFLLVVLFVSYLLELYDVDRPPTKRELLGRLPLVFAGSLFLLSGFYTMLPFLSLENGFLVVVLGLFILLQFSWRVIHNNEIAFLGHTQRVLIVGTGDLARQIGDTIAAAANRNLVLAGYFDSHSEPVNVPSSAILANPSGLLEVARKEKLKKIVVSIAERRSGGLPLHELLRCKFNGIEVIDAPSFYEQVTGKILLENITAGWFVFSNGFRRPLSLYYFKNAADTVIAILGLILALPFIILVSAGIKMTSEGPVFFRQVRVGKNEKQFVLYKFRTMRNSAESGTGPVWAQKNDPRVTPFGRFLRKTRLDEIPQLYNVLKGDMSFVGPRPERPEFVEELKKVIPFYSERHSLKPGITGWAQVRYPYGASVEDAIEKLRYDLYYIKNLSVILDILIILETVKVVIYGRGGR